MTTDNADTPSGSLIDVATWQRALAAVRETLEEIGLDVTLLGPPQVVMNPKLQQIDFVFRASPVSGSTAAPRSAEIIEVAWFALDALPALQRDARESLGALGLI